MGNNKSKSSSNKSQSGDGDGGGFNISDTVRNAMGGMDHGDSSEKQTQQPQRSTFVSFIYHRASNLFVDDDGLEGHEFYEETRKRSSGKWILKRVARRHLRHCEFQKLAKPFIHLDCPVVLINDEKVRQLGAT